MLFALITFLKGKPFVGTVGVIIPFVAFVSALRLAKPTSPWAHWFYDPERGHLPPAAREEARPEHEALHRVGWQARFERGAYNLIGGKPHLPSPE